MRDFDSKDPEGSGIEWNVRGVDAADFEISSAGVLTFMESPDYENATDRGLNLNRADGDFEDDDEFAPNDNNYQITVSATEMRAGPDAPLPAKRTDIDLTVIVGNVDDPGELTLQWLQPEVTVAIDTTLTDPDGDITSNPRMDVVHLQGCRPRGWRRFPLERDSKSNRHFLSPRSGK